MYTAKKHRQLQQQIDKQHQISQREAQGQQNPAEPSLSGHQSEQQLERNLINRLVDLGYEHVKIHNTKALQANLKRQLERYNEVTLSDAEFAKVLNHLDKGSVFARAKTLGDRFHLTLSLIHI